MFAGFNVLVDDKDGFRKYYKVGDEMYTNQKKAINESLGKYINPDGSLCERIIEEKWFPDINAHVFLSHSHNDLDFVISFAGWLYEKFEIEAFIDSGVWHNSDDLLRKIDNRYCVSLRDENGNIKSYDYKTRNRSTSNVHMILYTALMKMIDRTECLMFINTPSSLKWVDMITDDSATTSPWIYGELLASKLIRNRSRKEHRAQHNLFFEHADENYQNLEIEYNINTKHLIDINDYNLKLFEESAYEYKDAYDALDNFYLQNNIDTRNL
ncbi:MAG: hypothetical protein IJV15_14270 [Lachnospiraceae bacterium]|nr:hypothetical protein [Lachnospiraceae bacterium]MBR1598634.1 hypothetical protein [Lachnospiraceae bacterium]